MASDLSAWLSEVLSCPQCGRRVETCGTLLCCCNPECSLVYPVRRGVPVLLVSEASHRGSDEGVCRARNEGLAEMPVYPTSTEQSAATRHTSALFRYAIANRRIRVFLKSSLRGVRGYGVNFGAGGLTDSELVPACATVCCADIRLDVGASPPHVVTDIQRPGFAANSLDWVLCTSVLEHVVDPRAAIKEMARCLKPSGRLILTVPQTFPLHAEPADYWRFTPHAVRLLAEETGLSVLELVPIGSLRAVYWQQKAVALSRKYGAGGSGAGSVSKRIVLDALARLAEWHNAVCCAMAGKTDARTNDGSSLAVGAVLEKPRE